MKDQARQLAREALETLLDQARRSRDQEERVPDTLVQEADWQGLAFMLDGEELLAAMNELRELLPWPEAVTPVPGTQSWMLGLANVRGELLPVVDLQQFVGGDPTPIDDRCRILVIRNRGNSTGLLVPVVLGMRHMPVEQRRDNQDIEGRLGRYIYDLFEVDGRTWRVFSMAALANDEKFLSAARQ